MENASFPLGVVCTITLAFNIYMLALEIILLLKDHICKDKNVEFQVANEKKKALNTT